MECESSRTHRICEPTRRVDMKLLVPIIVWLTVAAMVAIIAYGLWDAVGG